MNDSLRDALMRAGWQSGTRRGFLRSFRGGIDWEVGKERGGEGVLLLYRYHGSGGTQAEGEVALPPDADRSRVEDAMTHVYQRVHEKPDLTRVFGGGKRNRTVEPARARPPLADPPPPSPEEAGQSALDL